MASNNPYTPPLASVSDNLRLADIDALPVSESWKMRFKAIQKAGGPKRQNLKDLTADEKRKAVGLNLLAFFFGPFYYLVKGMWKKGITLLAISIIVVLILEFILVTVGFTSATKAGGFKSEVQQRYDVSVTGS